MIKKLLAGAALLCSLGLSFAFGTISAQAVTLGSGSQSYRINVLTAVGIADAAYATDDICTRAEFAKLLVLSSTYKDTSETILTSAAANDVPATYTGAQYIKTALTNGWMRTRLGGSFQPEEAVTLNDAARATLLILGYTDDDFSSNISQERLSLFKSLELNEGVSAVNGTDTLTMKDAINVIYNLLGTELNGSSTIYGAAIDLTMDDDGELNATNVLEDHMVGPLLIKSVSAFESAFPFSVDDATYYYNGSNTGYGKQYIETHLRSQGWIIIYYNEGTRTIWAYGSDSGDNTYHVVSGKVTSILYEDDNIASPSSVYINSTKYDLNSSDVKFMFSLNGTIGVGDYCVLVCKQVTEESDDGDSTDYYAIAAIKWTESTGNDSGNVIYDINADKITVSSGTSESSGTSDDSTSTTSSGETLYTTTNSALQESEETL